MFIKLLNSIRHNGKVFEKGHVFDIGVKDGKRLVGLGVAVPMEEDETDSNYPLPPSTLKGNENETEIPDFNEKKLNPKKEEDLLIIRDMSIDDIKQELAILGVPYHHSTGRARLESMLIEALLKT
jgi:hypothetical protein